MHLPNDASGRPPHAAGQIAVRIAIAPYWLAGCFVRPFTAPTLVVSLALAERKPFRALPVATVKLESVVVLESVDQCIRKTGATPTSLTGRFL